MNFFDATPGTTEQVQNCDLCDADLTGARCVPGMERLPLVQCAGGGLVVTSPRPTKDHIGDWYPDNYYAHVPRSRGRIWRFVGELKAYKGGYPSSDGIARKTLYRGAAAVLQNMFLGHLPYMGPGRKVLDVGCGVGTALSWAKDMGWETVGVEMDSNAVEIARQAGLDVSQGTIESAFLARQDFDAITLSQVLEHTFSPTQALLRCRELLKPEGIILVAVPNFGSYFRAVMNEAWPSLELPRHLYHFDEHTLRKIAVKCGLVVEEIRFRSRLVTTWGNLHSLQKYLRSGRLWDPSFSAIRLSSQIVANIPAAVLDRSLRVSDNMLFVLRRPPGSSFQNDDVIPR